LKKMYKDNNLESFIPTFSDFHKAYKEINNQLWIDYGQKKISKSDLRWTRFGLTLARFKKTDHELAEKLGQQYIQTSPYQTELYPFAIDTLKALKSEGYPMHIITNGFVEVQHIKLRESKLEEYFDVVLCSESTGESKPHPVVFETALKMANARAEKSVMIGDDYAVDYLGALGAGMKAILFNFRGEKKVRHNEEVIEQLHEIPGRIPWLMRD
jgi:putative hydrolase of the HAD superfamily